MDGLNCVQWVLSGVDMGDMDVHGRHGKAKCIWGKGLGRKTHIWTHIWIHVDGRGLCPPPYPHIVCFIFFFFF